MSGRGSYSSTGTVVTTARLASSARSGSSQPPTASSLPSKENILICMWRIITKGIISIANPVRQMRSAETHTIYLPYYRAKLWKTGGGGE